MFYIFVLIVLFLCIIAAVFYVKTTGGTLRENGRSVGSFFILSAITLAVVFLTVKASETPSVIITEVCSNNFSAFKSSDGRHPDYIELYNAGARDVSLEGLCLSMENELSEPYTFGAVILQPGAYLLLVNNPDAPSNGITAVSGNFTSGSATAAFYGSTSDTAAAVSSDTASDSTTIASGSMAQLALPCAISKNGETIYIRNSVGKTLDAVKVPALACDTVYARNESASGFFISTPTPGTANSAGTPLSPKDIALRSGPPAYGQDILEISDTDTDNFSVLSISIPEKSLYGTDGIFLPEQIPQTGRASERQCQIDYFEPGLSYRYTQMAGIRVSGRSDNLTHLDFNLYARDNYDDQNHFGFDFFGNEKLYDKLILKYDAAQENLLMQLLEKDGLPQTASLPCLVYINGDYYGAYYLMEPFDETWLADSYDIKKKNLTVLTDNQLSFGLEYSLLEYRHLEKTILSLDLSKQENFDYACKYIDMDSLIRYYAVQIYLNNYELSPYQDRVIWRSEKAGADNPYADGKWRFEITGLKNTIENTYKGFPGDTNTFFLALQEEPLFGALLTNDIFYQELTEEINRLSKTVFSESEVKNLLTSVPFLSENQEAFSSDILSFFRKRAECMPEYVSELRN